MKVMPHMKQFSGRTPHYARTGRNLEVTMCRGFAFGTRIIFVAALYHPANTNTNVVETIPHVRIQAGT